MKNISLVVLCILLSLSIKPTLAQVEQCGTMKLLKDHQTKNPSLQKRMYQTEMDAKAWANANKNASSTVITIPVIVHVIHNTTLPDQNIPDSVIYSQIEVLNEDFRRMNADKINTRAVFDSIAADVEVEFRLATFDPSGNAFSGINRVASTKTGFEIFGAGMNDMKYTANGGADAWPRDEYLNLWVCNMTIFGSPGAILGFAQFPGDLAATDGVVIQYNFMGRTSDPVQSDSSLGRTATHEVGHWLGLRHIWADDQDFFGNGTCDSSDFVDDTPNQEGQSNYDCNHSINSCSNEAAYWGASDPPDMVENYMDYSADDCSNMFSMGQKARMLSFLNTDRLPLQSSTASFTSEISSVNTCSDTCAGEAAVVALLGTPPYNYLWSDPAGQTFSIATGLCAGSYSVIVTDSLLVSVYDTVEVATLSSLVAQVSSTDANCELCTDGSASATPSGGSGVYSTTWTDTSGLTIDPLGGLSPGTYVALTTDGCGETVIDTFTVGFWVSLEDQLATTSFELYPNPSTGMLTLSLDVPEKEVVVEIIDAIGESVYLSNVKGSIVLDLSHLKSGVYMVRTTSQQTVHAKSLVLFK